jgi:GTP-binding protein Era
MPPSEALGERAGYRSGFVSIVGRPNVGKSTLLNALLDRKVAITSPKPQTTRNAIRGVLSGDGWQMVFIDTPGLHKPKTALGERLNDVVRRTLREVDAIVFMVDATQESGTGDRFVAEEILRLKTPAICVANKMDAAKHAELVRQLAAVESMGAWREIIPISAREGRNVGELRDLLVGLLPGGPQYYPNDVFTDQPRDFLVAEIIREKALELTRQEVPHSIAVRVDEIVDREDGVTEIDALVYVERDSQKGIVIGKGGAMLKEIGTRARRELEWILGTKIFLRLKVKVVKDWQRDPGALARLGY